MNGIMGGKINIKRMHFWGFGGRVLREFVCVFNLYAFS